MSHRHRTGCQFVFVQRSPSGVAWDAVPEQSRFITTTRKMRAHLFCSNLCAQQLRGKSIFIAILLSTCSVQIVRIFWQLTSSRFVTERLSAYRGRHSQYFSINKLLGSFNSSEIRNDPKLTEKSINAVSNHFLDWHSSLSSVLASAMHSPILSHPKFEYLKLFNKPENDTHTFCQKNHESCQSGRKLKSILNRRTRFSKYSNKSNISIYIEPSLHSWYGATSWLSRDGIRFCQDCSVTKDPETSDLFLANLNVPSNRRSRCIYAALNMEAHSIYDLPRNDSSVILASFHVESDLVVTYAYTVMHGLATCVGNPDGIKKGRACENMVARNSSFYRWCAAQHRGDFFACIFNVIPHILRTAPAANKSRGALATAWVSATPRVPAIIRLNVQMPTYK